MAVELPPVENRKLVMTTLIPPKQDAQAFFKGGSGTGGA